MEPDLTTEPHLLPILDELKQREPIFHHPRFGTSREDFLNMTTDDFWEVGASGKHTVAILSLKALLNVTTILITRMYGKRKASIAAKLLTTPIF